MRGLEEEERQFQTTISFEQFVGGVERAKRVPRAKTVRSWVYASLGTCAVAAAIMLLVLPRSLENNRIKGDHTAATVRISGAGTQRSVTPSVLETLSDGERLRIGFRTATTAFLLVLSIDAKGEITPIYPESGEGLRVSPSRDMQYLPDSIEFTGQGQERLFLFLAPNSITVESARSALTLAFRHSQKNLVDFPQVTFPDSFEVQTYTWLFAKP
jgi:hypothetical protein